MFSNSNAFKKGFSKAVSSVKAVTTTSEKIKQQPFHMIIGEIHLHDTPIKVAKSLYKKLITMQNFSSQNIVVCLEVQQENVVPYFQRQKEFSDQLHQLAITDKKSYMHVSNFVKSKMLQNELSINEAFVERKIRKSIMMSLVGRERVLAYHEFVAQSEARFSGIDISMDYSMPPFVSMSENDRVNAAKEMRSMYMLQKLFEFQQQGLSTIFVVGQEHLLDLKEFMTSPRAIYKLDNYHFFNINSNEIISRRVLSQLDESVSTIFSGLVNVEVDCVKKSSDRISSIPCYSSGQVDNIANSILSTVFSSRSLVIEDQTIQLESVKPYPIIDNLFDVNSPEFLLVADKPLSQTVADIRSLSIAELKSEFEFDYNENVTLRNDQSRSDHYDADNPHLISVIERLRSPLNEQLVLCRIDEEVGYGVFTKIAIEAGTVIGLYAGEIDYVGGGDYGTGVRGETYSINAKKAGGVTRFIQHMPEDKDRIIDQIDSANFSDFIRIAFSYGLYYDDADKMTISSNASVLNQCKKELKEKGLNEEYKIEMETKGFLNRSGRPVATANTGWVNICYQGISVVCIVATQHIEANEQLGISYGLNYWNHKKKIPKYFDKAGYVIPSSHYLPELNSILVKYKVSTETELPTKELALRRAVYLNNVDDVQFLLEYGADVNDVSPTGKTALSQVGANTGLSNTKANIATMELIRKTLQARGAAILPIGEQLIVHGFSYKNTGSKNTHKNMQTPAVRK